MSVISRAVGPAIRPAQGEDRRLLRILAAVGTITTLYVVWQVSRWPPGDPELFSDLSFVPVCVVAIWGCWSASRRCGPGRLRSAWRLIAFAVASYLLGDLTWMGYALAGDRPWPSAADGFYLLFYPLMLAGVLRFPAAPRSRGEWTRLVLDLAVMALAGTTVVMYLVLGPTLAQSGSNVFTSAIAAAYPVGDLVLLVGLASMVLRGDASNARVLRVIGAGLLFFVAADLWFGYISLHGTYHAGDAVDTLWMAAIGMLAIGGAAERRGNDSELPTAPRRLRAASWAPYSAVLVAFAMLILSERDEPLLPDLIMVLAVALLAAMVSIRQILASRDLVRTQAELSYQSLHDALTGLPNRVLLIDRAERMLARARRNGTTVAAFYIDIDGFKHINDSFGHAAGDELLQAFTGRVNRVVRESDTFARLGGDEFVVLADDFSSDSGPEIMADRLRAVVALPIELAEGNGRSVWVTASIGVAVAQQETAEDLLRHADFALYRAKEEGKNRSVMFESDLQTRFQDRFTLEMDLGDALDGEELFLLYQPIFDLRTERATGVEALVRWRHPTRGVVPPVAFIPLAEETGLITRIGRWVLRTACEQVVAWRGIGLDLDVSVNVSARQLDQRAFVQEVADVLADTGLEPGRLTLEITESTLMGDPDAATDRLKELKDLGVKIAIDDFGTGYSSLAYLSRFPIDSLKIDRSFVAGMASSTETQALIGMLINLGKTLGLRTIGEGVEEQDQLRHLQDEQCDSAQGYLFARPLDPDAISQLLAEGKSASASVW